MKLCKKCGETKEVSEFYIDKRTKDGLFYCCKDCAKNNSSKNRSASFVTKSKKKEYNARYYAKNKEKVKALSSSYKK